MEDFCACKKGTKNRDIYYAWSSDRRWCSICKKDLVPDTEDVKKKRKKFLSDCHSIDDIVMKSFLPNQEWLDYKKKKALMNAV